MEFEVYMKLREDIDKKMLASVNSEREVVQKLESDRALKTDKMRSERREYLDDFDVRLRQLQSSTVNAISVLRNKEKEVRRKLDIERQKLDYSFKNKAEILKKTDNSQKTA